MSKRYISPTQLGMYLRCGEQYRRRYIEGEKLPPGFAMIKGGSVHKGAEINFKQKIESYEDLPKSQVEEVAAANFDGQVLNGYLLSPDEKAIGVKKVIGEAKDSAIRMVGLFSDEIAPEIQPALVEKRQYVKLENSDYDLLSILDVATVDNQLVDLKTAAKRKPEGEADGSDQLSWQAMAYRKLTGEFPIGLRLEVVIDTGKNQYHQSISTLRDESDTKILLNKINSMIKGVNAGIFLPAEPGAWVCDVRWCGYAMDCPYYSKRKARA